MAVFLVPRSLAQHFEAARLIARRLSETTRAGGFRESCAPLEPVPCPPCESAPQPACRPSSPAVGPRGLKQVCCAPSVGQRPPCTPPTLACPKTCQHARDQKKNVSLCETFDCRDEQHEKCGDNLDRVARRLAAAELTRRLDYEREVAERKPAPKYEPIVYKLAGERKCMRATDGCDYAISKQSNSQPQCGPCRTPPPPCPVDLEPVDNCEIHRGQYLDPCAHRPRVFVEIDRSQNSLTKDKPENISKLCPHKEANYTSSAGSLTTRIIDTLRGSGGVCSRQCCKQTYSSAGAQYVGDERWCANLPSPADTPVRCKEPSLTERLRRRSGGNCSKPCGSRHRLHTKTCIGKSIENKTNTKNSPPELDHNKLESLLRERSQLKETGLGRVVLPQQQNKDVNSLGTGVIELKIPPTSDSVRVNVSLNFDKSKSTIRSKNSTSQFECTRTLSSSTNDSNGSWLSIKNLQKKITGCRNNEDKQTSEKSTESRTCKPKPKCDKEAGPFGETPHKKLTPQKPHSPCGSSIKHSIKADLINTIHL